MPQAKQSGSPTIANPAALLNRFPQQPFSPGDITAGAEVELQAAVIGARESVDLAAQLEQSSHFNNLLRRARAGDTSGRWLNELEQFLANNRSQVWENSWVVVPLNGLSQFARTTLEIDLLEDKRHPERGLRADQGRFLVERNQQPMLRVPISYLVKLALADHLGRHPGLDQALRQTGQRLMGHFLNDNTSPETHSFHVVPLLAETGMGLGLARESAKRYLLTQLLVSYANQQFGLQESRQQAIIYHAPHPPERQKALNRIIPDAFYRELFMSPCLSGWDQGESKHRYMQLCHTVLSRSQLQGVAKLREAGIILNNLVVLPNVSSTSLANNGTHVSLGSCQLGSALTDGNSGFGPEQEKSYGDLAIKIQEHFLPLLVGTYSAAPYRLGFADFHPEKALGFLPHQLDYTHLRMLWRRWKGKARLSIMRRPLTPFGPEWLDRLIGGLFGLSGDLVPDFRLIDYPVGLLSTEQSPALDGHPGNQQRLRNDLHDLGVFDRQMSLYLPCKLREYAQMGFSGFEWRQYSLFPDFGQDLAPAVSLQALITAFAFRLIAGNRISHRQIPDNPVVESERRQLMFAAALGVPTVYVRRNSRNQLLRRILKRAGKIRVSRRYPGYLRIPLQDYQLALIDLLNAEAADLISDFDLANTLGELRQRLLNPAERSAAGRLCGAISRHANARSPLKLSAGEFNAAAEDYYRGPLRSQQLREALYWLDRDLLTLELKSLHESRIRQQLQGILGSRQPRDYLQLIHAELLSGSLEPTELGRLIDLLLCSIASDSETGRTGNQGVTHAA